MITVATVLMIIAIVIVLFILFKLLGLIEAAVGIPAPWVQIIYWVLVLLIVLWALSALGIMQPIIR
jgi:hypothetical protein